MVHTLPDYTTKYKMTTLFGNIDTGELAARLKSIVSYDRRGYVAFLDDFDGPILKWTATPGPGGGVAALSAAQAKSGGQSVILTAGAGAAGQAYIVTTFGALVTGKIGMEVSFTMNPNTSFFYMRFTYYDGVNRHRGGIIYERANDRWRYWDDTGNWHDLITLVDLEDTMTTWHTAKVVLDTSTNEYSRFLYDNVETSMAGIGIYQFADAIEPCIHLEISHGAVHAAVQSIYIDNVIVTQNEP